MRDDERLVGVRLSVDLEAPMHKPTRSHLSEQVRRLVNPETYAVTLERTGVDDPPSVCCIWSTMGWYLTRRGEVPADVSQGQFSSKASAVEALVTWADQSDGWRDAPEYRSLHPQPFPPIDTERDHWVRSVWNDGGIVHLYEFNATGVALRAIELKGPERVPYAAASLIEWRHCQRGLMQPTTPAALRHGLRYGSVPEGTEADWGEYPNDAITWLEFDDAWEQCRAHLRRHPRGVW